jgi:predicted AAA+ superfamily ATPase
MNGSDVAMSEAKSLAPRGESFGNLSLSGFYGEGKDHTIYDVETLFRDFKNSFFVKEIFSGYSKNIAMNAITMMSRDTNISLGCNPLEGSLSSEPGNTTIHTGVRQLTTVLTDCLLVHKNGLILAFVHPKTGRYHVQFLSFTKKGLDRLHSEFVGYVEKSNFYRGKCLQFRRDAVTFVNRPSVTMDDVVLPALLKENFINNTLDFITNPKLQAITKKRGVILYGPPGNGKTSVIAALFNSLDHQDVTSIFVAGDAFLKFSVFDFMDFVVKYLVPAVVVLEDFDLIAGDRNSGRGNLIGEVLSILDGIDQLQTPLVVVGTTNRIESIDAAAIRPARFDRRIKIDYPGETERKLLWTKLGGEGECPKKLLTQSKITGAHIKEVIVTYKMLLAVDGKDLIHEKLISNAVDMVIDSFYVSGGDGRIGFRLEASRDEPPLQEQEVSEKGDEKYPFGYPSDPGSDGGGGG